jgi:hypothetical protein
MSVSLTVAAHTNVGKTTLVRTLLKRDIGEVADRAHVTESAERHTLLDTPGGDVLYLWDTPGFGDSARLLKRLKNSGNPIGWLQTQVWDRLVDRPFFCSQQAFRNVRDESDLVLYLVNASEDAASAAYLDAELEILQWIGKPVLLLLNQSGAPRGSQETAADEARWGKRLAHHAQGRGVITLDAFARCWVQEDRLLAAAADLLPEDKRAEMARLREAWRARNLEVFAASMKGLAGHLAHTSADREITPEKFDAGALAQRVKALFARDAARKDPAVESAMAALTSRLDERLRADTDKLIALHGLAGRAKQQILARAAGQFEVAQPADVAGTGIVGGVLTGAAGGLAADLSTGGLSLGAGMVIGAILGALGAGGAARAYNVLQGQEDGRVRWSADFLAQRVRAALLLYLAVAHYGRGRGDWAEGEAPAHWKPLVEEVVRARQGALDAAWRTADETASADALAARLEPEIFEAARDLLVRLFPESAEALGKG